MTHQALPGQGVAETGGNLVNKLQGKTISAETILLFFHPFHFLFFFRLDMDLRFVVIPRNPELVKKLKNVTSHNVLLQVEKRNNNANNK